MASQVIVVQFSSRSTLSRALEHLYTMDALKIKRAAIIAWAKTGETVILNDAITHSEGTLVGGVLGTVLSTFGVLALGVMNLPALNALTVIITAAILGGLIGAGIGRLVAAARQLGVPELPVDFEMLASHLQEGHPALVMELENAAAMLERLQDELKDYRAEIIEPLRRAVMGRAPEDVA